MGTRFEWLRRGEDEDGQGLVEYGLILALVAIAAIVGLGLLGGGINDTLYASIVANLALAM